MKMIKKIAATVALATLITAVPVYGADTTEVPAVTQETALPVADPVDLFLSQSVFVGNSVGEGLTLYNNAMKKVPLGNAIMLTRVSYSFYADSNKMTKFIPRLNGVPMRAKDAIKLSGASFAFICMGTNDLVGSSTPEGAYAKYQQYLADIMTENPGVLLFIESCTPTRPGSNVNNDKVTAFNSYMQAYCDMFPNMFYVDIATPLKDGTGYLAAVAGMPAVPRGQVRAHRFVAVQVEKQIAFGAQHHGAAAGPHYAVRVLVEPASVRFRGRLGLSLFRPSPAVSAFFRGALRNVGKLRRHPRSDKTVYREVENQRHREQHRARQADERDQHMGFDVPLALHASTSSRKP